jgi:putative hydrolase
MCRAISPSCVLGTRLPRRRCGLLRGDLHCHSNWSDGTTSIADMVGAARALGHEYLALTDHSPRLRVANGLSPERLREQLIEVAGFAGDGFTLLSGIEVDILERRSRSGGRAAGGSRRRRRLGAFEAPDGPRTDDTPARRCGIPPARRRARPCHGSADRGDRGTRPPSQFDARAVFDACAQHGVAVEINARPEREDPPDDLIALALDIGCLFSIDSDAHAPGQLGLLDEGAARAERVGVPPERIVTTWPLDRLRAWTHRDR